MACCSTRRDLGARSRYGAAAGRIATCVALALALALLPLLAAGPVALAEDGLPMAPGWLLTLGSFGTYGPRFEGARSYQPGWRPIFDLRRPDSREWLSMPLDGYGFELIETDSFRMGPVATWRFQRHVDTTCVGCRSLGSIDASVEAGVFLEYWPAEWWRTRAELRAAAFGGDGYVADLSSDLVWQAMPALQLTVGPRLSLASHDFMQVYYGLSASEAAALHGLPFSPAGGLRSLGAGSQATLRLDRDWSLIGFVEWQHLAGPAGDALRVEGRGVPVDSVTVGLGASYTFAFDR